MRQGLIRHFVLASLGVVLCLPQLLLASSGREIMEKAQNSLVGESFRATLQVETFKGKKKGSEHIMWVMGEVERDSSTFLVDFVEPEESKGLRFLFRITRGQEPSAFMYLPATGQTVQVAADDPSTDIGGTGLTMGDFLPFLEQREEKQTLLKDEEVSGRQCHIIEISSPRQKGSRKLWIAKDQLDLVKVEQTGADGKPERSMRVTEFFQSQKGRYFPREELIDLPKKGIQIRVRQENAIFGISIPDELKDPKSFGQFRWRI